MGRRSGDRINEGTERKRAQRTVRKNGDFFEALIENTLDAIVVLAADGTIVYSSNSIERIMGYTPEERIGKRGFELIHPDDLPSAEDALTRLLKHPKKPIIRELRVKHADGSWHILGVVCKNMLDDPAIGGIIISYRDVTELRQKEQDFLESEEKYFTLVDQASDGIDIVQDSILKFVNKALVDITGYSKEELIGMHFLELVTPEYRDIIIDRYKVRVEDSGAPPSIELNIRCKDGTVKSIEATGTAIQYEGRPASMGVIRDVTERKQMEEALRESEERWRALVKNTNERIIIADKNGNILFVNRVAPGRTVEATIGTSIYDYLSPNDKKTVRKAIKSVFGLGKTERYEVSTIIPSGETVWYESSITPIKHDENIEAAIIITLDVTERKNIEQQLRRNEEYYRSLIENQLDAITVLNKDGTIRYVSSSFERLLGRKPEELLGHSGIEFVYADDMQQAVEKMTQLVRYPGSIVHEEVRVWHEDGSLRNIQVVSQNLLDNPAVEGIISNFRDITAGKQAEEELQQVNEFNNELISSLHDGLSVTDRDGNRIEVNPALCNMTGFSREELLAKHPPPYWPPEQYDKIADNLLRTLMGEISEFETTLMRKNGERFPVIVGQSFIRDANGDVAFYTSTIKDISERKQAEDELDKYRQNLEELVLERTEKLAEANEELKIRIAESRQAEKALRKSEAKYRELADSLPQIVFEIDLNRNFTFVNRKSFESFGYSREDIENGMDALQSLIPEDRERARENIEQILSGAKSGGNEYTALTKDGRKFPIVIFSSPIIHEKKPVGLRGVIVDITERKRMEEALIAREKYFESLIDNAMDVIATIDRHGTIQYAGPSLETVLGYSLEERIGGNYQDLVHPDDREKMANVFAELLQSPGTTSRAVGRYSHKDGSWRYIEGAGTNLLDDPAVKAIVLNFRDITESKLAEMELQKFYQEEKNLRQKLEEEMKRRVEFTRALAHELKTPLTSVLSSSDLLVSEVSDEPLQSLAKNIRQGASNLNNRIDELLDLARGEVGMLQLKTEATDILQVLRETADSMTALASGRGQSLFLALPPSLPVVEADGGRIQQVVTNLLNNAIKFTPKGGKIILRAKRKGSSVVVEVQDTGRGVSREEQERLFEPYQRLGSDEDNLSGLGLGLSLCKTLVELHGGKIWVRSHTGKGSIFGFSLPLNRAIRKKPEPDAESKLWKVLIIEDDKEIVDSVSLTFLLRWPEAELISTGLGEEGIELVETENPDIVILDLGLPDINGFEVLRQIRLFCTTPIVVLTVKGEESDMVKGLEWGANDYVVKPFRQLELLARLKVQLRKQAHPDEEEAIVCGTLRLDPATFQLTYGGTEISLTVIEGRIIEHLMRNAGNVVTHTRLAEAVWGEDYPGAIDSLRVYIRYLRQKLEKNPSHPKLILTKSGVGYSLAKPA